MTESARSLAVGRATRLAPRLWMGPRPPIGDALQRAGFDAVVLCARELHPEQPSGLYPGVASIRVPLDDTDEGMSRVEKIAAFRAGHAVADLVAGGARVLVTCNQGRNRSGVVCAAAIAELYGISGDDAAAWVRRARNRDLTEGYPALSNPHFCRFLRETYRARPTFDGRGAA